MNTSAYLQKQFSNLNAVLRDYHSQARQWSEKTYRRTSTFAADLRPMTRAALLRRGLSPVEQRQMELVTTKQT